jgi:hypothetical protein
MNYDAIHAMLLSPDWTEAEKWVVKWQYNRSLKLLSHFQEALAEAIIRADDNNLGRLRYGFPDQVNGFLAWNRGDLAKRLRAAGVMD